MIRRHFSTTFLVKCISFAGALVQGVFVTRLLGPEGKGLFSLLQANVGFLILLLGMTLPMGVIYFTASEKIAPAKLLALAYAMAGVALVLVAGILIAGYFNVDLQVLLPKEYFKVFYIVYFLLSFVFSFLNNIHSSLLVGRSYFFFLNAIEFVFTFLRVMIFFSLYNFKVIDNYEVIFFIDLLIVGFQWLAYVVMSALSGGVHFDFNWNWAKDIRPVFSYILPLFWTQLIGFLYSQADIWIIQIVLGLTSVGIYSIARGAGQLLTFFPIAVNTVLYTYLAKSEARERDRIFSMLAKINFAFVFGGAIILFFASDWLIPILYGKDFVGAVFPLKILVWGYVLTSVKFLFILYNQVSIQLKDNIISEVLVLFISMVLNFSLISRWGVLGTSFSMVMANLVALAFLLIRIRQSTNLNLWNCFVFSKHDLQSLFLKSKSDADH